MCVMRKRYALKFGLDLERSMFVVEIKIFNGFRDFFSMLPDRIGLAICQSFR